MGKDLQRVREDFLKALLLPIVRWCLRSSIKVQTIMEVLKESLVEAADQELSALGETVTPNRISVMTGVHRQDVNRVRSGEPGKKGLDTLTRVIGQWRNDKRFTTESNKPKSLTLNAKSGSFVELVSSISKEINPYTVALELERLNLVKRNKESLSLVAKEYLPRKNLIATANLLSKDIQDLILAGESNAVKEELVPNLHLTTRYDNIRLDALPKVKRWLMNEGAKLHEKARDYLSKLDIDINPSDKKTISGGGYVALGTFSLTTGPMENKEGKLDE